MSFQDELEGRFPSVWANVTSQNATLKIACAALSVSVVSLALLATAIGTKDPLIIDVGFEKSDVVALKKGLEGNNTAGVNQEIENFLRTVVPTRFDSQEDVDLNLMAVLLARTKESERLEYTRKRMTQTVVVRSVLVKNDTAMIEADRIVAVDKLRSAFAVTFEAKVAKVKRSEVNPYGLVLMSIGLKSNPPVNKILDQKELQQ